MQTFGLTSSRLVSVRLVRADGSVSSQSDFRRALRVFEGQLCVYRKERLVPVIAINGDVADIRVGTGKRIHDIAIERGEPAIAEDVGIVEALAPVWRPEGPKPAKAPKAPKAPKGPALAVDNTADRLATLENAILALTQQMAAFTSAKPRKR